MKTLKIMGALLGVLAVLHFGLVIYFNNYAFVASRIVDLTFVNGSPQTLKIIIWQNGSTTPGEPIYTDSMGHVTLNLEERDVIKIYYPKEGDDELLEEITVENLDKLISISIHEDQTETGEKPTLDGIIKVGKIFNQTKARLWTGFGYYASVDTTNGIYAWPEVDFELPNEYIVKIKNVDRIGYIDRFKIKVKNIKDKKAKMDITIADPFLFTR